jgi:hypothetical protein
LTGFERCEHCRPDRVVKHRCEIALQNVAPAHGRSTHSRDGIYLTFWASRRRARAALEDAEARLDAVPVASPA